MFHLCSGAAPSPILTRATSARWSPRFCRSPHFLECPFAPALGRLQDTVENSPAHTDAASTGPAHCSAAASGFHHGRGAWAHSLSGTACGKVAERLPGSVGHGATRVSGENVVVATEDSVRGGGAGSWL